jgi:hypothetical protein
MAESNTKPAREKQGACVSLSISLLNIHHAPPRAGFFIAFSIAAKLKLPTAAGSSSTNKASLLH